MEPSPETLQEILKGTSRAFYLSLAVLPAAARAPLSLAYLIARAADTIADAPVDDGVDRVQLLRAFHQGLLQGEVPALSCSGIRPLKSKEALLLGSLSRLNAELQTRPTAEREAILDVVSTLVEGMLWDQELFPASGSGGLDDQELERYTYMVAGCVGPFWSKVCVVATGGVGHLLEEPNLATAVEFGKALQFVNILRDVPEDQAEGRYYLPELGHELFAVRFKEHAHRALRAFSVALQYPNFFAPLELRHRMSLFWPLVLGLRTLEKLFAAGGPRPEVRVKVSRTEVLTWVALSPIVVVIPGLMNKTLYYLLGRARESLRRL